MRKILPHSILIYELTQVCYLNYDNICGDDDDENFTRGNIEHFGDCSKITLSLLESYDDDDDDDDDNNKEEVWILPTQWDSTNCLMVFQLKIQDQSDDDEEEDDEDDADDYEDEDE